MFYLIPTFVIAPLILMGLMIAAPAAIGKRMPPSFTKEKTQILNIPRKELYALLIDYENYPLWLKYISYVELERLENGKLKIKQTYKNKKIFQELTEVRRIENSEISIVKNENEFTALWTYILEDYGENETKMTIKETMYVYHPYLRFMLKYVLTDENSKNGFFRHTKSFINKNSRG